MTSVFRLQLTKNIDALISSMRGNSGRVTELFAPLLGRHFELTFFQVGGSIPTPVNDRLQWLVNRHRVPNPFNLARFADNERTRNTRLSCRHKVILQD